MPMNRLRLFLVFGLMALTAPSAGHAALVQVAVNDPAAFVSRDLDVPTTRMQAMGIGQSLCGDSGVCQEWRQGLEDVQTSFNFAALGPFGRMTFLVNFAVIAVGLLWTTLARRSLR